MLLFVMMLIYSILAIIAATIMFFVGKGKTPSGTAKNVLTGEYVLVILTAVLGTIASLL